MPRDLAPADYPGCPVTVTDAVAAGRVLVTPRWGLWDVLWTILGWALIGLAAAAALHWLHAPLPVAIIVGTGAPWIAMAGWPLWATWRRGNGPRIDLGLRLSWSDTGWAVVGGAVALLLAGLAALVTQLFSPDLTSAAAEAARTLREDSGQAPMILFAAMVMVGAPVVEELFFRGLVFAALRKRGLGPVLTILATALLFSVVHFEPLRLLVLLPSGLVLGWVRWKTGSTGASMVAHGLINAPGAIALLVGLPGMTP